MRAIRARRAALALVTACLVIVGEALATLTTQSPRARAARRRAAGTGHVESQPNAGEPQLADSSSVQQGARTAALRFVRDCGAWESSRLATIPRQDATRRVILLVEREGRHGVGPPDDAMRSVRIAAAGEDRYVVTSAVGNFLVARRGPRWMVVSLPGD
jgi:hypothetical protein